MMVAGEVEVTVKLKAEMENMDQIGRKLGEQLAKSIAGLNVEGIFKAVGGIKETGAKAATGGPDMKGAMVAGVAGGLAAGGIMKVLDFIAGVLMDMPAIAAVMKLFKLILMLLFMPLMPILKPVLIALAEFIKFIAPYIKTATMFLDKLVSWLGGSVGDFAKWLWDKILAGFSALAGIGKFLWDLITLPFRIWLGIGEWIWKNLIVPGFMILLQVGQWIWTNILLPAWQFLERVGEWLWAMLMAYFSFLAGVGIWIWNLIIRPAFMFLSKVGQWIWDQILKPAWNFFISIKTLLWDNLLLPAFQGVVSAISNWAKSLWDSAKKAASDAWDSLTGKKATTSTTKKDFIMRPGSAAVNFSPNDTIVGFEGKAPLGGQSVNVTINVDKPTVRSEEDIKRIVREISIEQQRQFRRYVSYV